MEQKPIYFDGSVQSNGGVQNEPTEAFQITDEVRKNIGKNPYSPVEGE
jgi:hypothetical protein